jgi:hypothetical protein
MASQLYVKGQKLPVEMTAFNSLEQAEQNRISVSRKDSTVKTVWHKGQLAYEITLHHTETDSAGNLVVYVGINRETVLGQKNKE